MNPLLWGTEQVFPYKFTKNDKISYISLHTFLHRENLITTNQNLKSKGCDTRFPDLEFTCRSYSKLLVKLLLFRASWNSSAMLFIITFQMFFLNLKRCWYSTMGNDVEHVKTLRENFQVSVFLRLFLKIF